MKKEFIGYYRPNEEELKELWEHCLFIVDANVLLNLYRYPKEACSDLLQVFQEISSRLWIPHQAALEYQENRLTVIAEQVAKFDDVKKNLADAQNKLDTEFSQLKKRHSSIKPDNLLKSVESTFGTFSEELKTLKETQPDVSSDDKLRDKIDVLFEGKVGSPPASQTVLDEIYKEGKLRYEQKRPPGYMDEKEKSKSDEKSDYLYGGLLFKRVYGDLVVWNQIIDKAKDEKHKHIIFITDDLKEDWWWIVNSSGRKTIGPRPELIEEIYSKADISHFYMYNSERFLDFAKTYLEIDVKQESIDQIKDISQVIGSRNVILGRISSHSKEAEKVEQAVFEWLKTLHSADQILTAPYADSPTDFLRISSSSGSKTGYGIWYIRFADVARSKFNQVYQAFYEISEGNLNEFIFIVVIDMENRDRIDAVLKQINQPQIPDGVSFLPGIIALDEVDSSLAYKFTPLSELT